MRWLWHEWTDNNKAWIGLGNSCNEKDRELFGAATVVSVGNGEKARFWTSPWLDGLRPKDIAPKLFKLAKRRNCTVKKALQDNSWVSNLNIHNDFGIDHIQQFVSLWELIAQTQLNPDTEDTIKWKFTNEGIYTASSAYKMQFEGICIYNEQDSMEDLGTT